MSIQDFLQFTFQSFWHFVGVVILITIPINAIVQVLIALINRINK